MKQERIVDLLINCFIDGKSVQDSIDFIERCYQEKVSDEDLTRVKRLIKDAYSGREWN